MKHQEAVGLIDHRLAKALSHPLRVRLLAGLNERVASPNELSEELGEPLGNVAYHVRMLLELGCIELVRESQKRGAIEHHYRAITRPFFSDRDWGRLPASARRSISDVCFDLIWRDALDATESGSLDAREDRHISRTPLMLDETGWTELNGLLAEVLDRAMEIQAESAGRLHEEGAEESLNTKLVLMHFESAPPAEEPGKAPGRAKRKSRR